MSNAKTASSAKAKSDIKFIGVDDGHSGTKIFAGYDAISKKPIQIKIDSIVKEGVPQFTNPNQDDLDEATIIIEGKTYMVGSKFAGLGDNIITNDYPTSGHNVALIAQALRVISENWGNKPLNLSIVTGLPLGHYFDKKAKSVNNELVDKKMANVERLSSTFSPADDNKPMFKVAFQNVQPEGWGSVLDVVMDDKGDPLARWDIIEEYGAVVIDIGGRTVDAMIIQAEAMSPIYEDIHTYDLGVLSLFTDIGNMIMQSEHSKKPPKRHKIEEVIKTGLYGRVGGVQRDYADQIEIMMNSHVDLILEQLKGLINSTEAEGGIIVTGGGAALFGDKIRKRLSETNPNAEVVIPVDPAFSNARGFWKVAKNLAESKAG